jgi:hypothetical protein
MDGMRNEFLPGARFSLDENGAGNGCHLFDLHQDLVNGGTITEDLGAFLQAMLFD